MVSAMKEQAVERPRTGLSKTLQYVRNRQALYLMVLPGLTILFLFRYVPMFGVVLAFKDYNALEGILGSRWVGLRNFEFFVRSPSAWRAFRNTLVLNISFLFLSQTAGMVLALLFNELRTGPVKKTTQSMVLLPHFMSWMIVGIITYNILNPQYGIMNTILERFGIAPINVFNKPAVFPFVLATIDLWKSMGYGSVIFLATLAGIDPTLYEAATIDGASRLQRMRLISTPLLMPAFVVLVLLKLGNVLNADFGMYLATVGNNSLLFPTSDVLALFIYRSLREVGDIGMSSAAGLFRSVAGLILVLGTNSLARRYQSEGALF